MRKISQTSVNSVPVRTSSPDSLHSRPVSGIGIELVDIREYARIWNTDPVRGSQWFTATEIAYCSSKRYPARHFAARLAAKRALLKAVHSTVFDNIPWLDIETVNDNFGYPRLFLRGELLEMADSLGIKSIDLSLTHTHDAALAVIGINLTATLASRDSRL